MTEVDKPADPHGLIGTHWPTLSATSCQAVSDHIFALTVVHENAAASTVPTASQVQEEFSGAAGSALLTSLHITVSDLQAHGASAGKIAGLMKRLANRIQSAKDFMRSECLAGTEAVDKAKEKDRETTAKPYRDAISDRADQLDNEVKSLSRSISTAVPGSKPEATGAPVQMVPVSGGKYQPVNSQGFPVKDGKIVSDTPVTDKMPKTKLPEQDTVSTPKKAATPAAPSSPSSPAGSSPVSPGQMPQMSQPGQSPSAPSNAGTPNSTGTSSSAGSPSSGSADSKSDSGSQSQNSNDPGLSGAMTPTLSPNQTPANPANTSTPANTATAATSAATPLAAKAAALPSMASGAAPTTALSGLSGMTAPTGAAGMGGLASTAPAGTGVTPGSPGVGVKGGVGVVAPPVGGVGPGVPGAPAAQTGTVVGTASPVGGGVPGLPGGGGPTVLSGGGAGSPMGGGSSTVVLPQHLTPASTAIGDQDRSSVMGLSSYVRELPLEQQIAHRRLAGFVGSLRSTGWAQMPVAVGVYLIKPHGMPEGAPEILIGVLATADGVCLLPPGVSVPAGLIPVTQIPGITPGAVAEMAGMADPAAKVRQLVPREYGELVALVTEADVDTGELLRCGDQSPAVSARGAFGRLGTAEIATRVDPEINGAILRLGRPSLVEAGAELRGLRWSSEDGGKPKGYDQALRRWYLADALSYAGTDRVEAAYGVGELLGSPELERDR